MFAGFAIKDITPLLGTRLNGFIARLSPSTGIDTPLAARALWLEDQQTKCLIVSVDALGLSSHFADRVVRKLASRLNVPERQIVLASTHTHSGPMTCSVRGIGPADEDYLNTLEARICEAGSAAAASQQPVQVAWGSAPLEIGVNRRQLVPSDGTVVLGQNPDGPADRTVRVLQMRGKTSSIVLFTHACHACCVGPQNSLISADFPGHAIAAIEEGGRNGIYLNGCAGDINPYQACQDPQAAKAAGQRLAAAVCCACENAQTEKEPLLRADSVRFELPHDELPPLSILKADLEKVDRTVRPEDRENQVVQARVWAAWNEWLNELMQIDGVGWRLPVMVVRASLVQIGRGVVVALPGEVFFEVGQKIAAHVNADPICVVAYCHGYIGYVPNREAFARGGYEVEESHRYLGLWRVNPAAEDVLQEQVRLLWKQLQSN